MTTVPNPGKQLTKEDLPAMVVVAKETGSLPVGRKLRIIEDPKLRAEFIAILQSAQNEAKGERFSSGEYSEKPNKVSENLEKVLKEFEGYDAYIKSHAAAQV